MYIILFFVILLQPTTGWGGWFWEELTTAEELSLSCAIAERMFADIHSAPEKQNLYATCKGRSSKLQLIILSKPMDRLNHLKHFSKNDVSYTTSDAYAPLFQTGTLFITRDKDTFILNVKGYETRKKLNFYLTEIGYIPTLDTQLEGPMGISIVIPTYNRLTECEACVLMLKARILAPGDLWEVIVVADGCTDGTGVYLREKFKQKGFENFRVIWTDKVPGTYRNAGWAENAGARAASFSFISFCDSDVYHLTDPVTPTLNRLRETDNSLLIGNFYCIQSPHSTVNQYRHNVKLAQFEGDIGYNPGWFAVRKKIFVELGGNSERYTKWGLEDYDMIQRLRSFGLNIEKLKDVIYTIADEQEIKHQSGYKDSQDALKQMMNESPYYRNQDKADWGKYLLEPPYPESAPQFNAGF